MKSGSTVLNPEQNGGMGIASGCTTEGGGGQNHKHRKMMKAVF
jgi:hypothetical protein